MTKQTLRKEISAARAALTSAARQEKNARILAHILQSNDYQAAPCIFTFISIRTEVDTHALMHAAWADGKQVAVPITAAGGQMYFAPITPQTPLLTTAQGTLEPNIKQQDEIHPAATDLFCVPGLVFDAHGGRYGYGGGFYDRYLARHPLARPIALAFALQICDAPIETQAHDISMHALITEHGWQKTDTASP